FRLDLWESIINRFNGIDVSSYVADGTLLGVFLIDEPEDPTNWSWGCVRDPSTLQCQLDANGNTIPDGGAPVSYSDIEAAAAFAKPIFQNAPMGVGSRPSQLYTAAQRAGAASYNNLDFAEAQYTDNKKDASGMFASNVKLVIDDFITLERTRAQQIGLAIQWGINTIQGVSGGPVPASTLLAWGTKIIQEQYACIFTMWKYDSMTNETKDGRPYNSYWSGTGAYVDVMTSLQSLATSASQRQAVACRGH